MSWLAEPWWLAGLLALLTALLLWRVARRVRPKNDSELQSGRHVPGVTIRAGKVPGVQAQRPSQPSDSAAMSPARQQLESFLQPGGPSPPTHGAAGTSAPATSSHWQQMPVGARPEEHPAADRTTHIRPDVQPPVAGTEGVPRRTPAVSQPAAEKVDSASPGRPGGGESSGQTGRQESFGGERSSGGLWEPTAVTYHLPFTLLGSAAEEPAIGEAIPKEESGLAAGDARQVGPPSAIAWLFRPENLALAVLAGEILRRPEHPRAPLPDRPDDPGGTHGGRR